MEKVRRLRLLRLLFKVDSLSQSRLTQVHTLEVQLQLTTVRRDVLMC